MFGEERLVHFLQKLGTQAALPLRAASQFGARVTGITLSQHQCDLARLRYIAWHDSPDTRHRQLRRAQQPRTFHVAPPANDGGDSQFFAAQVQAVIDAVQEPAASS